MSAGDGAGPPDKLSAAVTEETRRLTSPSTNRTLVVEPVLSPSRRQAIHTSMASTMLHITSSGSWRVCPAGDDVFLIASYFHATNAPKTAK